MSAQNRSTRCMVRDVLLLWVVVSASLVPIACGSRNPPKVSIRETRVVDADIEDYLMYRRLLGQDIGGFQRGGIYQGGPEIVCLKDDPNGKFVLLKVRIRQAYIDKMGGSQGNWNNYSSKSFELHDGGTIYESILLFEGQESKVEGGTEVLLPQKSRVRLVGNQWEVEGDGAASLDKGAYVRVSAHERLQKINPPKPLARNVWYATLQREQTRPGGYVDLHMIFPRPTSNDAKLVAYGDVQNAAKVKG